MELRALREEPFRVAAGNGQRTREVLMAGILVCGLACTHRARAEEPLRAQAGLGTSRDARLGPQIEERFDVGSLCVPATRSYSTTEFAARKYFAPDHTFDPAFDRTQSLRTTTVWQRLNDYRSKDRVRLVTLWENAGSSVSLQAGKHGEASLQWTSRAMNRGGSTRGLLDSIVAASLGAAGIAIVQSEASGRGVAQPAAGTLAGAPLRPALTVAAVVGHAP